MKMQSIVRVTLGFLLVATLASGSVVSDSLSSGENEAQKSLRMESLDPIVHRDQLISLVNRVSHVAQRFSETIKLAWNEPIAPNDVQTTTAPVSPANLEVAIQAAEESQPQEKARALLTSDSPANADGHFSHENPGYAAERNLGQQSTESEEEDQPNVIRNIAQPFKSDEHRGSRLSTRSTRRSPSYSRDWELEHDEPTRTRSSSWNRPRPRFSRRQSPGRFSEEDVSEEEYDYPHEIRRPRRAAYRSRDYPSEYETDALDYSDSYPYQEEDYHDRTPTRTRRRFFKRRARAGSNDRFPPKPIVTRGYPPEFAAHHQEGPEDVEPNEAFSEQPHMSRNFHSGPRRSGEFDDQHASSQAPADLQPVPVHVNPQYSGASNEGSSQPAIHGYSEEVPQDSGEYPIAPKTGPEGGPQPPLPAQDFEMSTMHGLLPIQAPNADALHQETNQYHQQVGQVPHDVYSSVSSESRPGDGQVFPPATQPSAQEPDDATGTLSE